MATHEGVSSSFETPASLAPQDEETVTRSPQVGGRRSSIMQWLGRITQNPEVMDGRACIRGMRVTVDMISGQIAAGVSIDDLLRDYPYLQREDIAQALQWRAPVG